MTNTPSESADPHDSDERTEADEARTEADEARTDADEARTDAAIRELKARVQWPRPPEPAPFGTPGQPPVVGLASAGNARRTATPMRKLGVGMLGLIGGLLVGLLARFIVPSDPPLIVALLLGAVTLTLAVAGVVIALVIDHRYLARRTRKSPTDRP